MLAKILYDIIYVVIMLVLIGFFSLVIYGDIKETLRLIKEENTENVSIDKSEPLTNDRKVA